MADLIGSMFSAISGMRGNTVGISISSDNLVNLNVVGYKANTPLFSTLVTTFGTSGVYSNGGLLARTQQNVSKEGSIISTDGAMDIAVKDGKGMIPINSQVNGKGDALYTRRGDFKQDKDGNYVNGTGNVLMAWPLDVEGRLPGDKGNLNTTPSSLLSSLVPVNIKNIVGSATATTKVSVSGNLNEQALVTPGIGGTFKVAYSTNTANNGGGASIGSSQIIIPETIINTSTGGVQSSIYPGNSISITSANSGSVSSFTYGGITHSNTIGAGSPTAPGTTPIFGAVNSNSAFAMAAGQNITINLTPVAVTPTTQPVILTFAYQPTQPNTAIGQFNSLATLSTAINEAVSTISGKQVLNSRIYNSQLYVAPIDGTFGMSFADNSLGATIASLGFSGTTPLANRFTTLSGLQSLISSSPGLTASLDTTTNEGVLNFNLIDPLSQMTVTANNARSLTLNTVYNASNGAGTAAAPTSFRTSGTAGNNGVAIVMPSVPSYLAVGQTIGISGTGITSPTNTADSETFGDGAYVITNIYANGNPPTNSFPYIVVSASNNEGANGQNNFTYAGGGTATIQTTNVVNQNGFGMTTGSNIITVYQGGHNFVNGDLVTFPNISTSSFNGLTVSPTQNYVISNANQVAGTYQITASSGTATTSYTPTYPTTGVGSNGPGAAVGQPSFTGAFLTANPISRVLKELGLNVTNGSLQGPAYDPTGINAGNMTNSLVSPQSSMPVQIFDSFGEAHTVTIGYLKTAIDTWAVEVWINDPTQVTGAQAAANGQLAAGTISFNGDGTLEGVTTSLLNPITINWANQALPSNIKFDWGTAGLPAIAKAASIGKSDGLGQFAADFSTRFIDANGYAPSNLQSINIDPEGYIIANFSTGGTEQIFKVPLIEFANVDGLETISGNSYAETYKSGPYNLRSASSTIGTLAGNSLEKSTADMSDELTNILVYQKSYQSEAKVIKIASELLETLINSIT